QWGSTSEGPSWSTPRRSTDRGSVPTSESAARSGLPGVDAVERLNARPPAPHGIDALDPWLSMMDAVDLLDAGLPVAHQVDPFGARLFTLDDGDAPQVQLLLAYGAVAIA